MTTDQMRQIWWDANRDNPHSKDAYLYFGQRLQDAILAEQAVPPQPLPVVPKADSAQRYCHRCNGSGEQEHMTRHLGPEDYSVTGPCDECGGSGAQPCGHYWVADETGSPSVCKHCGKVNAARVQTVGPSGRNSGVDDQWDEPAPPAQPVAADTLTDELAPVRRWLADKGFYLSNENTNELVKVARAIPEQAPPQRKCALCGDPARVGTTCDACHDSMGTKPPRRDEQAAPRAEPAVLHEPWCPAANRRCICDAARNAQGKGADHG